MLGEVVDAFGEQRDLDLRRAGVGSVRAEFIDDGLSVVHEGLSFATEYAGDRPMRDDSNTRR